VARLRNPDGDDFARRHLRWIDEQDDLSSLSIEGFALGAGFLDEVLARLAPAGVVHLHLWDADLGAGGARRLAASPAIRRLETLDLHRSQIGDDGAFALAESRQLAAVRRLILSGNEIRDAGGLALARSPHLGALTMLSLSENRIGPAVRAALRTRFGDATLPLLDHQRAERFPPAPLDDLHAAAPVRWRATWSSRVPFQAEVDGAVWVLRLGDFPNEPMYALFVDGEPAGELDDWPDAWRRPPHVTLRVELVAWARRIADDLSSR
jgi:hypothetical protein